MLMLGRIGWKLNKGSVIMPEMPEVETVRQVLRTQILGLKITKVLPLYPNMIKNILPLDFVDQLTGKTIFEVYRKGKYLFFELDDCYLISHLRMEGKYFIKPSDEDFAKHEHMIISLSNGFDLRYHDVRKFGVMEIRNKTDIFTTNPLNKLGMEPLTEEFTYDGLKSVIRGKMLLKPFLLSQEYICGIGNIYADEICYLAELHPETRCSMLSDEDIFNIYNATNEVIGLAIKCGGTTIRSYTSSLGVTGRFQQNLNCHTLVGKPCNKCKTIIKKIKVGGRGTYVCENCQKLK